MVVVDTSVWIDYFNGRRTSQAERLDQLLGTDEILIGDLILAEILQGFRSDLDFRRARQLLKAFSVASMVGPVLAVRSAENYRKLRKQGVTVRKTIDVMIATYCLAHHLPLLYSDRDFDPMVRILGLITVQ